jgi:glyoxylase-like metal-dependent hydrolase (beta-lactamase superfamily II)
MKIEMFNVGYLNIGAGMVRQGEKLERLVRLPVPAYLIETASERILVDTGLHPAAAADAAAHYGRPEPLGPFRIEQDAPIAEQVDLASLTKVVLTHLHFDHAGALSLLPPGLPVIVQRREWEAGHDAAAIERNFFVPADYADVQPTLVDGDHDLLGDGSIRLILTPGHTPGHQSVVAGSLIIGGDVALFASALDDHRMPAFGDDLKAQVESAERLRALRDAGAVVLPGHDPEVLVPGPVATFAAKAA